MKLVDYINESLNKKSVNEARTVVDSLDYTDPAAFGKTLIGYCKQLEKFITSGLRGPLSGDSIGDEKKKWATAVLTKLKDRIQIFAEMVESDNEFSGAEHGTLTLIEDDIESFIGDEALLELEDELGDDGLEWACTYIQTNWDNICRKVFRMPWS